MSGAFRPVNSPLTTPNPDVKQEDMPSPSPPQPMAASQLERPPPTADDATTPTRASFHASLSAQKSLPSSPFPQAVQLPNNEQQPLAMRMKGEDVDMEEPGPPAAEPESGLQQDEAGSDDDSVNADGTRSSKKKKSQRFYCTGYPPCNLSFTRSEHLARHIRKHTGERPFKCHCSRRFSRLDNLRQHAQTVHINEDIPLDSLAASGSRYQRQIRTDRVRPTTGRARANTAGSIGVPIRGHSKSLSTSSIASIGSVGSVFGAREDLRHRPAPLVMADHRTRLSMESYQSNGDSSFTSYRHPSPGDFSTPTSATFSTNQSSPRWSAMASPTSAHSRSHSMFTDNRVVGGRRLSVPSGANPFQPTHGGVPGRQMMPANSSHPAALSPHSTHFMMTPSSGWTSRRDSISTTASEEAWRRRTWHPDTRNFAAPASTLDRVATAELIHLNPPQAPPQNPNVGIRLPGIESFTSVARPLTPPRRPPSPMAMDTDTVSPQAHSADSDDRRGLPHWDIHRGLTRLDISKNATPPRDGAGAWAKETDRAMQAQAEQARANPPVVRFQPEPPSNYPPPETRGPPRSYHQHTLSAPSITTPRESKRHGWYHGPVAPPHAVPEHPTQGDLGPDPNSRPYKIDRMVHPNIAAFPGFPAREAAQPQPSPQQSGQGSPESHRRLDALVAVATSEGKTAAAH